MIFIFRRGLQLAGGLVEGAGAELVCANANVDKAAALATPIKTDRFIVIS